MRLVVDTCIMIGEPRKCAKLFWAVLRQDGRQVMIDSPTGPCWLEILKHSPTPQGENIRREKGDSGGRIADDLYQLFIRVAGRSAKTVRIPKHDGKVSGILRRDLKTLVDERQLNEWWRKDEKWISLAQNGGAADLFSTDKGFRHAKQVLGAHGIRLLTEI